MTKKDDGGPAFPAEQTSWFLGMSLRDYFAGQAVVGILARDDVPSDTPYEAIASACYSLADAMLEARK